MKGGGGEGADFEDHMVFRGGAEGGSVVSNRIFEGTSGHQLPMGGGGGCGGRGHKNTTELTGGSGKFYYDKTKILRPLSP